MIAPRPPAASRPPAALLSNPDRLHQRIGNRADGHGGGDARPGRAAEQERCQHHGAAGAVRLVTHDRHGEVDEEFSGAGMMQERAIDREQDDQRGRHVDRDAEDAFERDEEVPNELTDVEAAMRPWRRQIRPGERIGDEQQRDERDDPSRGAPRCLEQQRDEHDAEHDVEMSRHRRAIGEFLAAFDRIDQYCSAGDAGDDVPPADPVAKSRRKRKQQKAQHQHESHVRVTQRLRRDDREVPQRPRARNRGVEVKQRHHHRHGGDQRAGPTGEAVDRPLLGLDKSLRLAQLLSGHSRVSRSSSLALVLGHVLVCLWRPHAETAIRPALAAKSQNFSRYPISGKENRERKRGPNVSLCVFYSVLCSGSAPSVAERRLRRRQPGDRHSKRRARDIVEPELVAERDRGRIAAVLAADPELEVRPRLASAIDADAHELADAIAIDRHERITRQDRRAPNRCRESWQRRRG